MATQAYARPPYSPTRFPAGVTNANVGTVLGNLGTVDPTKLQIFWEDYIAAPAALGVSTGIAGAGGLATVATTVPNDTPTACFVLDETKRFFYTARISMAAVAQTILVGFANDLAAVTDGVTISIVNNTLTLSATVASAAVTDTATLTTVDATMYEVGFEYDPRKGISAYVDGEVVARLSADTDIPTANLLAGLLPTGTTVTVDYQFAAVER